MVTSQEWSTRTFGNEDRLPRVPLPALSDTCDRFLAWCAPLLTDEQLAATEKAVADFAAPGGPGEPLHAALAGYDATAGVHSWLDTFWPARYLGRRDRIALNANFFFLFADAVLADSLVAGGGQVERAATLTAAAVDYKLRLDQELIPPVTRRGVPQTMEQNKYLFSATRIPGPVQDTVRVPYSVEWPGPSRARHIVVFNRGNLFRLEVLDPGGAPYPASGLATALREIMRTGAGDGPGGISPGALTTKARAEWAASRAALLACDPANAVALDTIETALFCLGLEDFAPAGVQEACDQLLHGDSANRWFDKAVSLIVFGDGRAGINVEHCGLDGTTILSFTDDILGRAAELAVEAGAGAGAGRPPVAEPVTFVLDGALRAGIAAAAGAFADYAAATATTMVSFEDFGADQAKQLGVSPDAFVQLAYQLAHQRARGLIGATYESISTRQYDRGRTEAMRVVTPEIVEFVAAMDDPRADDDTRRQRLRAAAAQHAERARQCQAGQAPEQHLWELQLIQRRRGAELGVPEEPELYRSPGWLIMRDDYLSTSSAPSERIQFFGFGSTSNHCIGVAYVLLPDRFNVYLSAPRAMADELMSFAAELRRAVPELQALLKRGPELVE
jgi:carnitine O-acetyltransferase